MLDGYPVLCYNKRKNREAPLCIVLNAELNYNKMRYFVPIAEIKFKTPCTIKPRQIPRKPMQPIKFPHKCKEVTTIRQPLRTSNHPKHLILNRICGGLFGIKSLFCCSFLDSVYSFCSWIDFWYIGLKITVLQGPCYRRNCD